MDGIKNRIHPGDADGQGPVRPAARGAEATSPPSAAACARRSARWKADHDFLLAGDVFGLDQIESYIELKWTRRSIRFEHTPHPVEFEMYYSV